MDTKPMQNLVRICTWHCIFGSFIQVVFGIWKSTGLIVNIEKIKIPWAKGTRFSLSRLDAPAAARKAKSFFFLFFLFFILFF